ncbi:PrsW family glutamic-type intramembrane protease [Sedimentibacter sp.]|uniref:PrsW family intramembrane metalloprotease n=1 Tax=Sedimentibacter sp. TaxID=1960295 RepID=UPI0028ABD050|nr:PrsW family glutamic-type intramembrane protease [Sedimentibacter sp.]
MKLNLLITAITPGIALGLIFYLFDRHDREPIGMLLKVFVMGMISVIPTIIVENFLLSFNVFGGILGVFYTAFIVAGFTEEYLKRRVVLKHVYFNPVYNEKLDGIVYCVMSALGFATIENIMYVVFRFSDIESIGLYRAVLSVPAHMLFAVTMGYYLSLAKFSATPEQHRHFLSKSLTVPVILHGIFDFILMSNLEILMLLFIPFVIYLWVANLKKLNVYYKDSKNHVNNDNDNELL